MPVKSNFRFKEATAAVVSGLGDGLEAAAEEERKNIRKKASQGQDATGAPWAPLAPETVARKGHSKILFETGDMLGSTYAKKTGPKSAALGISDGKINIHEHGTESIPARPVLAPAKTHLEKEVIESAVGREIRKQIALLKFRGMF